MQITLKTALGHTVTPALSMVVKATDVPGGEAGAAEWCVMTRIDDDRLMDKLKGTSGLLTKSGVIYADAGAFWIVSVIVGKAVVMHVLDLGDAAVWRMQKEATPAGLPVALVGNDFQKLVRVPRPDNWGRMLVGDGFMPADTDLKLRCMRYIVSSFDSAEGLRELGHDDIELNEIVLAIGQSEASVLDERPEAAGRFEGVLH